MYLMDSADVERELLRLHQFRKLHYEVAGSLAQLKLPAASATDYARELRDDRDWKERLTGNLEPCSKQADPRPQISAYHDMPYAIFRYPPEEEFAVRQEIALLRTRLEQAGKRVTVISLAECLQRGAGGRRHRLGAARRRREVGGARARRSRPSTRS